MTDTALAPAAQHYRDAFEQLRPALRGSPARRAAAMARFTELGFPGARDEAWKYTNLRRLESRRFVPAAASDVLRVTELPAAFAPNRVVIENGRWRALP